LFQHWDACQSCPTSRCDSGNRNERKTAHAQQEVQRRAGPITRPGLADWLPAGTRLHLLRRVFVLPVGGEVCSGHLDPSTGLSAGIRFGPWIRPGPLVRSGCASSEILTQVFNVSRLPTFHLHPTSDGGGKKNIPKFKKTKAIGLFWLRDNCVSAFTGQQERQVLQWVSRCQLVEYCWPMA